jgi:hypothetical protein
MTASQQAKSTGLKNLLQVTELTGVRAQTLINWHKNKPKLFNIVLLGCLVQLGQS